MFADVVARVVAFLASRLAVPVSSQVPKVRPAAFVTVARVGGAADNRVVDRPVLQVRVWAGSEPAAAELANEVRGLLFDLASEPLVKRVEESSGPADDVDLESGHARVSLQVRLTVRALR